MREIKIYFVLFIFFCGCTVLRRTTTTTDEVIDSNDQLSTSTINGKQDQSRDAKIVKWQKDSADSFYDIRFWPKGRLSFSPDNGFTGEFDSVRMKGKTKKITHNTENLSVKEQSKISLKTNKKQEMHQNSKQQHQIKESLPAYFWIVACCFLVGIALFYLIKR